MPKEQFTISTRDGDCPYRVMTLRAAQNFLAGSFSWTPRHTAGLVRHDPAPGRCRLCRAAAGHVLLRRTLWPIRAQGSFRGRFRRRYRSVDGHDRQRHGRRGHRGLLAYLDTRGDVAGGKHGAVGFCIGGGMALAAAGTYPNRFGAVAGFHGGNLATDAPTCPHLLASKLKAEVYIAAA